MKRLSLVTLAFAGFSILACAGGDDGTATDEGGEEEEGEEIEAEDLPEIAITEPWRSMNLPLNDGQVVLSDPNVFLAAYDAATVQGLTNSWPAAVEGKGWDKSWDGSDPTFTVIIYTKKGGTQQLGLAIGQDESAPGVTFVYLEDLDKVPEGESTVKSAKSGKRKMARTNTYKSNQATRNSHKRSGGGSSKKSGGKGGDKKGGKKGKKHD